MWCFLFEVYSLPKIIFFYNLESEIRCKGTLFLLIMQEFVRFFHNFMLKMTHFSYKIILIYASLRSCAMMKPRRVV